MIISITDPQAKHIMKAYKINIQMPFMTVQNIDKFEMNEQQLSKGANSHNQNTMYMA